MFLRIFSDIFSSDRCASHHAHVLIALSLKNRCTKKLDNSIEARLSDGDYNIPHFLSGIGEDDEDSYVNMTGSKNFSGPD